MSHDGTQKPAPHAASGPPAHGERGGEALPDIDVRERGAERDGQPQIMDRRLFMQFLAFDIPSGSVEATVRGLTGALAERRIASVVYDDVNDARGIGLLTWSEDPAHFVTAVRPVVADAKLGLEQRPELTMFGRTYSTGYENDLSFWLIDRPKQTVLNEAHPWAIWYPLRRSGAFAKLEPREQGSILREHGTIGRAYGAKDLAHDVRLACYGLDQNDNDFVIGLIGKDLHPLSHIVQAMRKTRQTSEFIEKLGPFFVGRAAWRSPGA